MSADRQLQVISGGGRKSRPRSAAREYMENSRLVSLAIFIVTVAAIAATSFVGLDTLSLPVQPNQYSQIRVTAATDFSYESPLMSEQARTRMLARIPPVYQIDLEPYQKFETSVRTLLGELAAYEASANRAGRAVNQQSPRLGIPQRIQEITERFNENGPYRATPEDVAALLAIGDTAARQATVENGLGIVREIYREGVHEATGIAGTGGVSLLRLRRSGDEIAETRIQTMEEALTYLRVNVLAEGQNRDSSRALFRLLRNGVGANLTFDAEGSARLRGEALANIKPVMVNVERGDAIIEPGMRVTPEQYEMLQAYRQHIDRNKGTVIDEGFQLFGRVLLVLSMVLASVIYIRLEDRETILSNTRLGLLALVVILNLAIVRGTYSFASLPYFLENFSAASLLPYIAPTALAPLIVAILIDAGSAIFMALLISIFTSVIYGNRLDLLVLTFLASMVGIYYSREVRRRGRIVKAAGLGGLVVACFALLIGLVEQTQLDIVLLQMGAGIATGVVTGIAVAGLLPVLEALFKRTTDITLLELTDYNHPLLHQMQVEAPGTYHHSLIVAQLAENAASMIGANPLLCRVCALFHDIGKSEQPEYFTENQRDGNNPHDKLAPALSATVIKSHVEKGYELARKHNLPRPVRDVILQHHGTTLVQFFYKKARQSRAPGSDSYAEVEESQFRYDGPKPRFKESAIIFLADPIEAATRTLRTVNASQLGTLIDKIFSERIADGQLDEAPLTFEDLAKIKTSLTFTLLNMLHSRVAYAGSTEGATPAAKPAADDEAASSAND